VGLRHHLHSDTGGLSLLASDQTGLVQTLSTPPCAPQANLYTACSPSHTPRSRRPIP
jgi:hypothetical protein